MRNVRKRRALLLIAAAVAVLAVAALLLVRAIFVTRNVVIEGTVSASDEEIIRAANLNLGGPIGDVREEDVRKNLEKTGKYALDGLEIRRPSTVVLHVRQRTRDAMVPLGGRILVADSDGYVIEICNTLPENSGLYVRGLTCTDYSVGKRLNAPEEQLEAMRAVLEAVRSQNAGKYLSELNVSDANRLWMVSRTGIRVELGDSAQMEDKLRWACSAIADLENRGETLGTLDVSSAMRADFKPQS